MDGTDIACYDNLTKLEKLIDYICNIENLIDDYKKIFGIDDIDKYKMLVNFKREHYWTSMINETIIGGVYINGVCVQIHYNCETKIITTVDFVVEDEIVTLPRDRLTKTIIYNLLLQFDELHCEYKLFENHIDEHYRGIAKLVEQKINNSIEEVLL